ncbi:MAG TPA: Type 1 glutamine amidotransferase-like domain-containing protein [Nodosilinea sp.]|nr:Type 1 glutamine amidotransferase-like domain-containing protein [Nodosilinea sp.]
MKTMFLASSFADVADLFVTFTDGECQGKTVTFIPTASLPEEVKFYVAAGKAALEKHGLVVNELEISTATREQISSKLQDNDYIYVTGGNAFFLLQELSRTGAGNVIAEQIQAGKLYIGESAGSVVMSRNIEYVKTMDNPAAAPNLNSFSSLGLVDFYPLPHYTNFPFEEAVEGIIANYAGEIDLCPISNTQAIIVRGSEFEVVGQSRLP